MERVVRVKDLQEQTGAKGPRELLYCPRCGNESSANRSDYFMADPETVLCCNDCDVPMRLATKRVVFEDVKRKR